MSLELSNDIVNEKLDTVSEEIIDNVGDNETQEEKKPKKRGRKPKKKVYFGDEEELAFEQYVNSKDEYVKNKIFRDKLYYPFTKMIESIIRRYNLFTPDEEFEDTFHDTMSFLITKINNFDTTKNKKAYSYCGTICKNYLILKRTQYTKKIKKQTSYDLVYGGIEHDNREDSREEYELNITHNDIISKTTKEIRNIIESNTLNENEIKIGNALLSLFENLDEVLEVLGSRKYNKLCILQYIKDFTDLSSKEIRDGMKVYKELYTSCKNLILDKFN